MRSSCASRPPEAGDFVLRTPSVSPLERAKGRRALDPAKNACAFFRNKKNNLLCKLCFVLSCQSCRGPVAQAGRRRRNPRYERVICTGGSFASDDGTVAEALRERGGDRAAADGQAHFAYDRMEMHCRAGDAAVSE